jgi:hypothetical protein
MIQIEKMALAWGVLLAFGCGGDSSDSGNSDGSGGTPGVVDTGLPEGTPLEDVTAQQYASACQALRADVSARVGPDVTTRGVCEVYGAALTDDPATCRGAADLCVRQVNAGNAPVPGLTREQLDFTNFECGDVGELQGCSVTVGEFETCMEDQISAYETLTANNDCSKAASIDLVQAQALTTSLGQSPPSCARVQQECPGIGPFASP